MLTNILLNNASQSNVMMDLYNTKIEIQDCCKSFVNKFFNDDALQIAESTEISQKEWHQQRKYRVTGSRIYEIFTYSGINWIKKSENYFTPQVINNKYVVHGLRYEDEARKCFINATKMEVHVFGLIVPHNNRWLGYSPDGIIFDNDVGTSLSLLEIKCPFAGKLIMLN